MAGLPKGQREQGLADPLRGLPHRDRRILELRVQQDRGWTSIVRQQHADALVTMNQKAKMEVAKGNVNEIRRQLAEYQQNLMLIRSLVPTGNEVPSLLEQISTAARRVGLDVATVDPQPVVEGENYDTYRYTMSVVGGYHELAEFLANVGNLTRIVLPVNVTLSLPNNAATLQAHRKAGEAVIEAKFQLQTFVTQDAGRGSFIRCTAQERSEVMSQLLRGAAVAALTFAVMSSQQASAQAFPNINKAKEAATRSVDATNAHTSAMTADQSPQPVAQTVAQTAAPQKPGVDRQLLAAR